VSDLVYRNKVRTVNPTDTTVMHRHRESDSSIVPEKRPNAVAQKSPCEEIRVLMGKELSLKLS